MDPVVQVLNNLSVQNGVDRISELPDSVMTHILSRLPTHESVRTCILSRAWLMKWTSVLCLYFDDATPDRSNQADGKQKFCRFVDTVLQHCANARIQNFTLLCVQRYDQPKVNEWISAALNQGVRRLYVRHSNDRQLFPSSFFNCESLEEARLLVPCIMNMPPITRFNNLKLLFISRTTLLNENHPSSEELCFNFPVLEDFTILCCIWKNVKVMRMEAPRLSSFHMAWCRHEDNQGPVEGGFQVVKISSACLISFKWAGSFAENYDLPRHSTITRASLDHIVDHHDFRQAGIGAAMLLAQFSSSLVHLQLSIDIAEAMDRAGRTGSLPMLEQLTILKLESRSAGSTRALMSLLRRTPNVRVLEVHVASLAWRNDDFEMLGALPTCVMIRLERVYFRYRFGTWISLYLMKLLLRNAHALRLLQLDAPEISNFLRTQIRLQLLIAPRASTNVVIEVL